MTTPFIQTSPLLRLPLELRQKVYSYVYAHVELEASTVVTRDPAGISRSWHRKPLSLAKRALFLWPRDTLKSESTDPSVSNSLSVPLSTRPVPAKSLLQTCILLRDEALPFYTLACKNITLLVPCDGDMDTGDYVVEIPSGMRPLVREVIFEYVDGGEIEREFCRRENREVLKHNSHILKRDGAYVGSYENRGAHEYGLGSVVRLQYPWWIRSLPWRMRCVSACAGSNSFGRMQEGRYIYEVNGDGRWDPGYVRDVYAGLGMI